MYQGGDSPFCQAVDGSTGSPNSEVTLPSYSMNRGIPSREFLAVADGVRVETGLGGQQIESFDVFGTCLFRLAISPEAVFYWLGT
jgi:hypothetical protein